jgi:hypothetical protein
MADLFRSGVLRNASRCGGGYIRNRIPLAASHKDHMRTSKYVRLNNQRHAELLGSRIEELDQRLALLNSERGRFERLLDGLRE